MCLNVIHMIFLEKKVSPKSRNIPNLREVTTDQKCQFLYLNFMKVGRWPSVLEGDKFVGIAKDQVIQVALSMDVKLVVELEKWKELSKSKVKLNKCKWNVINAKELVNLHNLYVLFVMGRKFKWSREIYYLKFKEEW